MITREMIDRRLADLRELYVDADRKCQEISGRICELVDIQKFMASAEAQNKQPVEEGGKREDY
jgi:hypothetical protein